MPAFVKSKGLTVRLTRSQKRALGRAARKHAKATGRRVTISELLRESGLREAALILGRDQVA